MRSSLRIPGTIGNTWDEGPGQLTFFVEVPDLEQALSDAEALGGKTLGPPRDVPTAGISFAYVADPEGHVVGLSHGLQQGLLRVHASHAPPAEASVQ